MTLKEGPASFTRPVRWRLFRFLQQSEVRTFECIHLSVPQRKGQATSATIPVTTVRQG
jgi:hypothetical protein